MTNFNRDKLLRLMLLAFASTLITLLGLTLASCQNRGQSVGGADEVPFIAVTQSVENLAFNAVRDGIKDELAEMGYEEGEALRWEWRSAQGNPVKAAQIADKYVWARPDVIVAIATPSAQPLVTATKNTPVIFSAVSDPIEALLVKNIERPGGNTSGVSDRPPVIRQLALIREIMPTATTVGIIYDATDANSVSLISLINENTTEKSLTIQAVTASTDSEVETAANSLAGLVDAIYVLPDSRVISAIASVIQVSQNNQIPVFGGDKSVVESGAIATISFDYYGMGRQTGAMVAKVLEGNRAGDLPVEFVEDLRLLVNLAAAESMGIELPASVTSRADETL